jgi:2-polyprenyl-3-methyl-5-hydroxy-6-metoxy-1,4-benzoquinol methylase
MRVLDAITAIEAYGAFAPYHRSYADSMAEYLDGVDRIVVSRIQSGARSLLDVGAGDGVRAARIAERCGIDVIVLVEPCEALATMCREQPVTDVWPARAEALPETPMRFDVVTCLWNVLGHIPTHADRVSALVGMRGMLGAGGTLFVDVNNRYNARAYGWPNTLARIAFDAVRPSTENGDVTVTWRAGDVAMRTTGHVFTPREIESLFRDAELAVRERFVVDYANGMERGTRFEGQLLYALE